MVHHLVDSFGLLKNVINIDCDKVDDKVLEGFHSADYLSFVKGEIDEEDDDNDDHGLGALFNNIFAILQS